MISLQREPLTPFIDEAMPLFERHWREISANLDIPLEPDRTLYAASEAADMLRVYTVRGTGGDLYGYALFFVRSNAHYASSKQAVQDIVFIAPEYRQGTLGMRLLRFAEDQLRAEGVQAVYHHVKLAHPALGKVLSRMGYQPIETIYSKRLDKE